VWIAGGDARFGEHQVVLAGGAGGRGDLFGFHAEFHGDVGPLQADLQRLGNRAHVHGPAFTRRQQGRGEPLRPAPLLQEGGHRPAGAAQERPPLAPRPHARGEERLQRDGRAVERDPEDCRVDRGCDRLADLLAGERLLLGLERQVADARTRNRERPLRAARRLRREPHVERPRVELRLGVVIGGHVEEDEAVGPGRPRPVAGDGLQGEPSAGRVDDAVGPSTDEAVAALGRRRLSRHPEPRMGKHRQQRCVRLDEGELHRAGVDRAHLLHDARRAAEQRRPYGGGGLSAHAEVPVEARRHRCGGECRSVMKAHIVTQGETPDQAVA